MHCSLRGLSRFVSDCKYHFYFLYISLMYRINFEYLYCGNRYGYSILPQMGQTHIPNLSRSDSIYIHPHYYRSGPNGPHCAYLQWFHCFSHVYYLKVSTSAQAVCRRLGLEVCFWVVRADGLADVRVVSAVGGGDRG